MVKAEDPLRGRIIGRLVEVGTKHPKGVDRALDIATVIVVLALVAVTIETVNTAINSIYGQRIGSLVQPAIQRFVDTTDQMFGQNNPFAPR